MSAIKTDQYWRNLFGGIGPERETLADLATLEGGWPPAPDTNRKQPPVPDQPGGRWKPVINRNPGITGLRPPQIEGYQHPGSSSIVIYRKNYQHITDRTADDAGWSLYYLSASRTLTEVADGTLSEVAELGETLLLEGL